MPCAILSRLCRGNLKDFRRFRSSGVQPRNRKTPAMMRYFAAIALALGLIWGHTAPAYAQSQQDCARQAVRSGKILPLQRIVGAVQNRVPGRLVGVNLRGCNGGPWIYQLRMRQNDGGLQVVNVDARNGRILGGIPRGPVYREGGPRRGGMFNRWRRQR